MGKQRRGKVKQVQTAVSGKGPGEQEGHWGQEAACVSMRGPRLASTYIGVCMEGGHGRGKWGRG